MSSARTRRLLSDYNDVVKRFNNNEYIEIIPEDSDIPEKYRVIYHIGGIYISDDNKIEKLEQHEVVIQLHSDYPRYKPICKIETPIFHPNFRNGQICIGDIWGAGESLGDIIVNIGDMIQFKSWNSTSPLSANAAKWALENSHLFPVDNRNLYFSGEETDYKDNEASATLDECQDFGSFTEIDMDEYSEMVGDSFDIDVDIEIETEETIESLSSEGIDLVKEETQENDFEITAEELKDIDFIPTSSRTQSLNGLVERKKVNYKTILKKGIIWSIIGGVLATIVTEQFGIIEYTEKLLSSMGYESIVAAPQDVLSKALKLSNALFSFTIAGILCILLGIGEGLYYGSKRQAIKYAVIGATVGGIFGYISGYMAQSVFYSLIQTTGEMVGSIIGIRAIGWMIMGIGVGFAVGIIKPERRRFKFCLIGGLIGGFVGGSLFDICFLLVSAISKNPDDMWSRLLSIIIMCVAIGFSIGLLEQLSKDAWLQVTRGAFEGKEYLIFPGDNTIGNNGSNTIVLFKDKFIEDSHCEIVIENNRYVLKNKSTSGTIVNGEVIESHPLKKGDSIAIGNTVLVFNSK